MPKFNLSRCSLLKTTTRLLPNLTVKAQLTHLIRKALRNALLTVSSVLGCVSSRCLMLLYPDILLLRAEKNLCSQSSTEFEMV